MAKQNNQRPVFRKVLEPIRTDDNKHAEATDVEVLDEQSKLGNMPVTGTDEGADATDLANEMNLYERDKDLDNPEEVGVAEQIAEIESKSRVAKRGVG